VRRLRPLAPAVALAVALALAGSAGAASPAPYRLHDPGGFLNILPPGQNGLDNKDQLLAYELTGARPPHNDDQLAMYGDLVYAVPGLTAAQLPKYFKDASFGVKLTDVGRTYSPRSDVTIVRDKPFGVPHIYGTTRGGAMFGAGYVAAEDRLFFIDVLRHLGRAQLSSFVGGAPGNRAFDASEWSIAPYKESDLQRQIDQLPKLYGAQGARVVSDANNYVEGINEYIKEAGKDQSKMPGEYAAINKAGPAPWNTRDIIATAALVGGIFGAGGGREVPSAQILQALQRRFGRAAGRGAWHDFRSADDPEAPTTVRGKRFNYQKPPDKLAKGSLAIPDRGSVQYAPVNGGGGGGAAASAKGTAAARIDPCPPNGLLCLPSSLSNALVVSARESKSGHPLAVFGPQTGYFAPQILMEEDIHGPGIDARGAAFPGVNQYVELGRGRDYAWSATSAGEDVTDTFAVPLCTPNGSKPTRSSNFYRYRGKCLGMENITRHNAWVPSAADQTPPGQETLNVKRTALGLVIARARVGGKPVAYTSLRSTYMHEVDSALGFVDFNDPTRMRTPQDFQRAANKIGYTFNWLYVNPKHDAYFNSGASPLRAKGTSTNFPVWGKQKFEWQGWNPTTRTCRSPSTRRRSTSGSSRAGTTSRRPATARRTASGATTRCSAPSRSTSASSAGSPATTSWTSSV
jgi:acyl-homoserine lactone acylase PvdQ